MAKGPTKHGLEKKFKPWRKGQSVKAKLSSKEKANTSFLGKETSIKKGGRSLKNQLRNKERFLSKLVQSGKDDEKSNALRKEVEKDIKEIKEDIKNKGEIDRQKKIAAKYHQIKFFERQRLTRMERKARKKLEEAKQAADFEDIESITCELEQICMDQLYVAYFPNDTKYLSIFGPGGQRLKDVNEKATRQREQIKKDILTKLKNGYIGRSKSWVNTDILKAKNFDLSFAKRQGKPLTNDENEMKDDACDSTNNAKNGTMKKRKVKTESVTATGKKEKLMSLNNEKNMNKSVSADSDDSSSDDSSSEEDEKVDKMSRSKLHSTVTTTTSISGTQSKDDKSDSSSDSSSSSSSSSSDSDSDSSNTSDNSTGDNSVVDKEQEDLSQRKQLQIHKEKDEESEDDFLVDDNGKADISKVFAEASREEQSYGDMHRKGDKSKGWQTQKQRPGEWKGGKYQKKYI